MPTTDIINDIINQYGIYILLGVLVIIGVMWFARHKKDTTTRHDYLVKRVKEDVKEYDKLLGTNQRKIKLYWMNDEIGIIKSRARHSKPFNTENNTKIDPEKLKEMQSKKYLQFEIYKDNLISKLLAMYFSKTTTIIIPEELIENPNFDIKLLDEVLLGKHNNSYHAISIKREAKFTKFLGVWILSTPEMVEYVESIAFKDGYEKLLAEMPPLATNASFINNRDVASGVAITEASTKIQEDALNARRKAQR